MLLFLLKICLRDKWILQYNLLEGLIYRFVHYVRLNLVHCTVGENKEVPLRTFYCWDGDREATEHCWIVQSHSVKQITKWVDGSIKISWVVSALTYGARIWSLRYLEELRISRNIFFKTYFSEKKHSTIHVARRVQLTLSRLNRLQQDKERFEKSLRQARRTALHANKHCETYHGYTVKV